MRPIKVLLIGPYPPPYGGLAVQMSEWQRYLEGRQAYECVVLNIGESRASDIPNCLPVKSVWDFARKVFGYARRGYLIHLVTNGHNLKSWLSALCCALAGAGYGRRTVLVFGSGHAPEYMAGSSLPVRMLIQATVKLGGRLICRNERMRQALIGAGAEANKIAIVPGFLGVESSPGSTIPPELESFFASHDPVLGATANLQPEYGIALMLEGLEGLRKIYPRVGLVVIGPEQEAGDRFDSFARVREHVRFTGPLPHACALDVMRRLAVFLRPTYFDGDSNSVREAIAFGVPVVASDTDYRPEGVVRFRKGDVSDMVRQVHATLARGEDGQGTPPPQTASDHVSRLVNLYQELVGHAD